MHVYLINRFCAFTSAHLNTFFIKNPRKWEPEPKEDSPSCLIDSHTKVQLQRDIINVPDQQKTDAVLFIKGPVCKLDQHITLKLFAAGAATCLFSQNKDAYRHIRAFYLGSKEQRYYSSSKKKKKEKSGPSL